MPHHWMPVDYFLVFITLALFAYLVYTLIIRSVKGEHDERTAEETSPESSRRLTRSPAETEEVIGDYPSLVNLRDNQWLN